MGCRSCKGCQDSLVGNTQKSMVAWIQPCSAGPANDVYSAMTDGDWPAVKVTGKSRQWRGARTPQWRRNSDGTNQICHVTEAVPGDNTVTLEFTDCGCGGFSADEIVEQGSFDLYEMQRCCGLVDINQGWSRIKVTRCLSFSGVDEAPSTSYDSGEDGELTRTYTGGLFAEAYTIYPLTFGEVANDAGFDTGTRINQVVFANASYGCTDDCADSCADKWYGVTDEGNVIYRLGKGEPIQNSLIPGFVTNISTLIGIAGTSLVVVTVGGFWRTELDSQGAPTTWTFTTVTSTGATPGTPTPNVPVVAIDNNNLLVGGQLSLTRGFIYTIDRYGNWEQFYINQSAASSITGLARCGKNMLVGRNDGVIMHAINQCSTLVATPTSPAAAAVRTALQPGGTYWAHTATQVWYSKNQGDSWTQITLPGATPTSIRRMVWFDAGIGYIVCASGGVIYATIDGGKDWTTVTTGDRINNTPNGASSLFDVAFPCCKSPTQSVNTVALAGNTTGGVGGVWIGSVESC